MKRAGFMVAAISLAAAACTGGSADDRGTGTSGPASTPGPTTSTEVTIATTAAPATTTTTTTTVPGDALLAGLEPITLNTPESGGGIRPELSWEPVAGADHYAVYVYAPNGRIYWSWQGRETSVPVGGRPVLPDAATGPSVVDGMTWAVVAYDTALQPVGSSAVVPIGP
jgi:hypothetical protein